MIVLLREADGNIAYLDRLPGTRPGGKKVAAHEKRP